MHTLLIDRANRCWEVGLSERTYWDCDNVLAAFNSIVNGRAASRAEVKRNSCAGISDAHECRRRPFDLCALPGKAGLDAKDTTCATLARQAMADGDPDRVYGSHHGELPATTRCCPNRHSAPAGNCDASRCRSAASGAGPLQWRVMPMLGQALAQQQRSVSSARFAEEVAPTQVEGRGVGKSFETRGGVTAIAYRCFSTQQEAGAHAPSGAMRCDIERRHSVLIHFDPPDRNLLNSDPHGVMLYRPRDAICRCLSALIAANNSGGRQ